MSGTCSFEDKQFEKKTAKSEAEKTCQYYTFIMLQKMAKLTKITNHLNNPFPNENQLCLGKFLVVDSQQMLFVKFLQLCVVLPSEVPLLPLAGHEGRKGGGTGGQNESGTGHDVVGQSIDGVGHCASNSG